MKNWFYLLLALILTSCSHTTDTYSSYSIGCDVCSKKHLDSFPKDGTFVKSSNNVDGVKRKKTVKVEQNYFVLTIQTILFVLVSSFLLLLIVLIYYIMSLIKDVNDDIGKHKNDNL